MPGVVQLVAWEIKGFLVALAAIVAGQLLGGQISTKNLLCGRKNDTGQPVYGSDGKLSYRKTDDTPYLSPERVQLLLMTLGAAFYYLTQVLNNKTPGKLPDVPTSWTATVGGSNVLYLGGKALSRFWPRDSGSKGNPT